MTAVTRIVPPDLVSLSLEQLMDVEVTSFSKRHQRLFDAAATIHVITSEDLRRTGYEISTCTVQVTTGVQNLFHRRHTAFGTSNGGQVATQIE